NFHGFDTRNLTMCGLPSKNPADDAPYSEFNFKAGKGWTIPELRRLVGRPIGVSLFAYGDHWFGGIFPNSLYTHENFEYLRAQGYDFICIAGIYADAVADAVADARATYGWDFVLEAGVPHASDDPDPRVNMPYNLRDHVTPELVAAICEAGADIVDIPACDVEPGFTQAYVGELVDVIHAHGKLASVSITRSTESSTPSVIERIALDNKQAGADIFTLYGGGIYEGMPYPETLQALCMAVKGRRYTLRRMCQSPLR
ncbi:MAG: hypothetical protein IJH87_06360, partial [Atopobiaceae bacterium]|nr:hypothetical protein [Atopobiaceae bacterium]